MRMREEHDRSWKSPEGQRGNFPNEEFFVRRTEGRFASDTHGDDYADDDYDGRWSSQC